MFSLPSVYYIENIVRPLELGDSTGITIAFYLSLSHGHVFLTGVVIPAILLFLTFIAEYLGFKDINYKSLSKAFVIYVIGSLLMVSLLIYKGLVIIYYYNIYSSLAIADKSLFLGNHVLRESLYGIAHLLLGIGLIWYAISLATAIRHGTR